MTIVLCGDELVLSTPNSEPSTYYVIASTLYGATAVLETFKVTVTDARKDQTVTIREGSASFAIVTVTDRWVNPAITGSGIVQPVVVSGDVITMLGIGGLTIGMPKAELVTRSVVAPVTACDILDAAPTLYAEGISISTVSDTIDFIVVHSPQHPTQSGVAVGMTMGKVKQVYGDKVAVKTVTLEIDDPAGQHASGVRDLQRQQPGLHVGLQGAIQASDVVTQIYLLKGGNLSIPVEIC